MSDRNFKTMIWVLCIIIGLILMSLDGNWWELWIAAGLIITMRKD